MVFSTSNRTKVFISYSHQDAKYLGGLLPHLKYLENNKLIDLWADTKIRPGERWQDEIELALASAAVAILLISIDFLVSQFIVDNELPPLLTAAETEGIAILPIILRPCTIPKSLLRFQAINSPSRPLAKMKGYEREELWVRVANATIDAIGPQESKLRLNILEGGSVTNQHNREKTIPRGYWDDFANLEQEIQSFIKQYGTPGIMPTNGDLKKNNRDDLQSAIAKHGGFAVAAKRLGVQLHYARQRDTARATSERKVITGDFDVFLCHNGIDKSAVKLIGEHLKERGLLPWLDEWELQPGLSWMDVLEKQIGQIKSAAVFVGQDGVGPWQQMEIEVLLREFVQRGCPVIPVLLEDAPKEPKLPIFLQGMMYVDFRWKNPDPMEMLMWGITGRREL